MKARQLAVGLIAATVAGFASHAAHAAYYVKGVHAYVYGGTNPLNGEAPQVHYDQNRSQNITFGTWNPIDIYRLGTGSYQVDFEQLAIPTEYGLYATGGGMPQVTAQSYGSGVVRHCVAAGWYTPDGTTESVWVDCFDQYGAPADSEFWMNFIRRESNETPGPEAAYVWAFDPSSENYDAASEHAWNSTGQPITISHYPGTGYYTVRLGGQDGSYDFPVTNGISFCGTPGSTGGTAEVTAVAWSSVNCNVSSWWVSGGDTLVNVVCFDGVTGAPAESEFGLVYGTLAPISLPNSGFFWSGPVSSPGTQTSSYAGYAVQIRFADDGNSCPNYETDDRFAPATTRYDTPGVYQVVFPEVGTPNSWQQPPFVQVTPYTYYDNSNYCTIASYATQQNPRVVNRLDAVIGVQCYDFQGNPADTQFTLATGFDLGTWGR